MRYSGDQQLPHALTPQLASPSEPSGARPVTRVWARSARHEIEARLDVIQRAALAFAASPTDRQRAALAELQEATGEAREALDTLDALLAFRDTAPRLAPVEISDLLISALSRWKTRAPRHTFELALPGHEPTIVSDGSRVERAIDALIAWMVASSHGGDVRVALRYAAPPDRDNPAGITEEAIISVRAILRDGFVTPELAARPTGTECDIPAALSLTLAREVAAAHGGRVWASPGPEERMLTLGLALPSTPSLAPYHLSALMNPDASVAEGGMEEQPGAASRPSLPLARQRQVALVAHGDPRMARYLRAHLERGGYRALTAADLASALRLIDEEEPDILLLDAALPAEAPHDPLQRALARTTAPVILLTREASPTIAASALEAGAADVIAMPFSIEETLARVRRALRVAPQTAGGAGGGITVCGDLVIDDAERRVTLAGAPVTLSKTEYRLLRALARNAGKTVSHESLLAQVWGPAYSQEIEFIWVYIRRLRRKIEPDPARPRYIQTAPGVGYQLTAPAVARSGA